MRILLYLLTVKQYIELVKYNYDYVDEQEHIARKKIKYANRRLALFQLATPFNNPTFYSRSSSDINWS